MTTLKVTPTHDNIIIEPMENTDETESGIVIVQAPSETDKPITFLKGKVCAAGKGMQKEDGTRWEVPCKVGDIVYIREGSEYWDYFEKGIHYIVVRALDIAMVEKAEVNYLG